jgi:hypothetical protein
MLANSAVDRFNVALRGLDESQRDDLCRGRLGSQDMSRIAAFALGADSKSPRSNGSSQTTTRIVCAIAVLYSY